MICVPLSGDPLLQLGRRHTKVDTGRSRVKARSDWPVKLVASFRPGWRAGLVFHGVQLTGDRSEGS